MPSRVMPSRATPSHAMPNRTTPSHAITQSPMRPIRLLIVTLLAAGLGRTSLAGFESRPESTRVPEHGARVELAVDRPIPVIRASINGKGPFPFILDTGSAGVVLDDAFARDVGLEVIGTEHVRDGASGTEIESDRVAIGRLEIGGAVFSGVDALAMSGTGVLGASSDAPRGIIGRSAFADCLFTVDYPRGLLLIEDGRLPPADGRSILAYALHDGTPEFTVVVAGTKYAAHIDSGGSSGITLPFDAQDALPLEGEPTVVGKARGAGGSFDVYGSRLKGAITLGAWSWESPQVTFAPGIQWVHLGTDVLERFSMTWDQRNQRVRFHDPTGTATDRSHTRRPKRYGVRFDPNQIGDGALIVEDVVAGMAAAAAGLRAGDRIVALDGRSVSGLSQLDLATLFRRSPLKVTVERDGETVEIMMTLD